MEATTVIAACVLISNVAQYAREGLKTVPLRAEKLMNENKKKALKTANKQFVPGTSWTVKEKRKREMIQVDLHIKSIDEKLKAIKKEKTFEFLAKMVIVLTSIWFLGRGAIFSFPPFYNHLEQVNITSENGTSVYSPAEIDTGALGSITKSLTTPFFFMFSFPFCEIGMIGVVGWVMVCGTVFQHFIQLFDRFLLLRSISHLEHSSKTD